MRSQAHSDQHQAAKHGLFGIDGMRRYAQRFDPRRKQTIG